VVVLAVVDDAAAGVTVSGTVLGAVIWLVCGCGGGVAGRAGSGRRTAPPFSTPRGGGTMTGVKSGACANSSGADEGNLTVATLTTTAPMITALWAMIEIVSRLSRPLAARGGPWMTEVSNMLSPSVPLHRSTRVDRATKPKAATDL
jgi:hypothetical protein